MNFEEYGTLNVPESWAVANLNNLSGPLTPQPINNTSGAAAILNSAAHLGDLNNFIISGGNSSHLEVD